MDAVETEEYKGCTIEIMPDECGESPRDWENLCEFHCWHRRMDLGDFNYNPDSDTERDKINEVLRGAKKQRDIVLALYIYQHSGIALSLRSFRGQLPQGHYEFDSGQVGFVIIRREKIIAEFTPAQKRLTPKAKERAIKCAEREVKTYTQYLDGDVYGYIITNLVGEDVDSCWGFYGIDECMTEAKSIADSISEHKRQAHQKKLKAQIIHGVSFDKREPLLK